MVNVRKSVVMFATVLAGHPLGPEGVAQAKTVDLAPITPWNVDYGEKICTLRRGFGHNDRPSVIIINRFGPTDRFQLTIVSDEFKSFSQGQTLSLQFGEQKPRRLDSVIPGQTSTKTATLFFRVRLSPRPSTARGTIGTLL